MSFYPKTTYVASCDGGTPWCGETKDVGSHDAEFNKISPAAARASLVKQGWTVTALRGLRGKVVLWHSYCPAHKPGGVS